MNLICPEARKVGADVFERWSHRHKGRSCSPMCRPCQRDEAELQKVIDACSSRNCVPGTCLAGATANS